MCYKLCFLILLFSAPCATFAQGHLYVNTDNLILRDRPEHKYHVFAILHAPCRVDIEPYGKDYINVKAITNKFYHVSLSFTDSTGIHHYTGGWVEKKYMAGSLASVKVPEPRKKEEINESEVWLTPYVGPDEHNPNKFNAAGYPAPKYKGGEKQTAADEGKRTYHKGARGGCYYISSKGRKVYVDKRFCKGSK